VGGGQRSSRDGVSRLLGGSLRHAARSFGGLRRLFDRDKPQSQRWSGLAADPYGASDPPTGRCFFKLGKQIDRGTGGIEPARIPPAGPHNDIGAGLKQRCYPIRLHISAIA
jgi:hypothetical protein